MSSRSNGVMNVFESSSVSCALGYPVEELIGRLWMDFVHPEDAQATIETAREMARHDIAEFVNRYRRKDGTWVRLSWRCSAWAGGLTYGIVRVLD
jgi:PAS domain S-box-containing protein